jgi:hypothetical protein
MAPIAVIGHLVEADHQGLAIATDPAVVQRLRNGTSPAVVPDREKLRQP